MNVAKAFATYLQDELSVATIGQDLYIGHAPSSTKAPSTLWWIKAFGGDPITRLSTGETMKQYIVEINYRNRDYETVYEQLQSVEENINSDTCSQITGFDTVDLEATTFPIDNDLDSEDRKIGLLRITLTIFKEN